MTREDADKLALEKYPVKYEWRRFGDGMMGMFDIYSQAREMYVEELMKENDESSR